MKSPRSLSEMHKINRLRQQRKDAVTRRAQASFRSYLQGFGFLVHLKRRFHLSTLRNPWRWYTTRKALKDIGMALTREGELIIGLVLMRNVILIDHKKAVAPALVLASFDFSARGFQELRAVWARICMLKAQGAPSDKRAVEELFEDEEYHSFRRRPLPACLQAPAHMLLFDEVMRGDDQIDCQLDGTGIPWPCVVMFANRGDPFLASAVVPRNVAEPVVKHMAAEGAGNHGDPS